MTPDYKALCAELTNELSGYKMANPMHDWFLLNRARTALAEPELPADGEVGTRYEFSVLDADCVEQAGGSAPSLAQALDEGRHYLASYAQDGPHTLELRRVELLTSNHFVHVPKMVEPADGEVAELEEWLRANALTVQKASGNPANGAKQRMNRAADLLSRLAPQPAPEGPSDEEIMALMPPQMHADLAHAARAMAGFDSPKAAMGAIRNILNCHAVDHARAVLDRWGSAN